MVVQQAGLSIPQAEPGVSLAASNLRDAATEAINASHGDSGATIAAKALAVKAIGPEVVAIAAGLGLRRHDESRGNASSGENEVLHD